VLLKVTPPLDGFEMIMLSKVGLDEQDNFCGNKPLRLRVPKRLIVRELEYRSPLRYIVPLPVRVAELMETSPPKRKMPSLVMLEYVETIASFLKSISDVSSTEIVLLLVPVSLARPPIVSVLSPLTVREPFVNVRFSVISFPPLQTVIFPFTVMSSFAILLFNNKTLSRRLYR